MHILPRSLLRAGLLTAGLSLLTAPAFAQSLSGNGGAAAASATPTGTAGTAVPGTNASLPMFDATTGKGLLTTGTPLPSGTNTLGSVGVTTLPALPTGTNAIGTVGVTALPALPAGTNSIGSVVTLPTGATSTEAGGTTSATAGTFTSALAASPTRKGCLLQNTSASVQYVFFGLTASATTASATQVSPGASIGCSPPGSGLVLQDNIAIAGAGASAAYVIVSQ